MTNIAAARELIALVRALGVDDFCACAGSRNSQCVAMRGEERTVFSCVEERSAAFFGLGRIKLRGRPVAVVTTSGTAVAELLPATIEAHYSGLPLVLITADRPARYHGTGAPQSIEQSQIFGVYAVTDPATWCGTRPLHLNIEFDEPLIDDDLPGIDIAQHGSRGIPDQIAAAHGARRGRQDPFTFGGPDDKPVVLIGGLSPRDPGRGRDFALRLQAPVYAEPLSGLREDPGLERLLLRNERMLARGGFQRVIRIGGVPTVRFWRDLDEKLRDVHLISFSRLPFAGLSRGGLWPLEDLPHEIVPCVRDESLFELDCSFSAQLTRILD